MLDRDRLETIRLMRDSVGAIAPRDGTLTRVRRLRFTSPGYDPAVWRQMAELGWIGLRLSEDRGGVAMGLPESVALQEELGRGLVPEPLIAGSLAAAMLALTNEEPLLARVLAGEARIALAWQGAADTLDWAARLDAPRLFVPIAEAEAFLLPVREGDKTALVLVEASEAEITPVEQQDGGRIADLRVKTGAGRVVSRDVGPHLARALDEAAFDTAAYLLGLAERAFAITLAYLKQRRQFDQPLAAFQALQHRAADMKIQLTLARASIERTALQLDAGADARERAVAVSRAKARATDTAMLVGREAIQMHGAIGYADECDIGLFTRKAMVVANRFGSAMMHRRRFASLADDLAT